MRTVFVNPSASFSNPRRKKKKSKKRASAPAARKAAPKRRKRRSVYVTKRGGGMKRVNAGITPFVANPLSVSRPRRRSRKRNPMAEVLDPKKFIKKSIQYSGGALVGTGINLFGLRRIENDYFRNGARVVVAVVGGAFMPGDMGASMAGATLYPLFAELAMKLGLVEAPATEIDLSEMGVDLEDVLNDNDDADELFEW